MNDTLVKLENEEMSRSVIYLLMVYKGQNIVQIN